MAKANLDKVSRLSKLQRVFKNMVFLEKILKRNALKKVLIIKNSIGQNASEQKSSLLGIVRPSHLPYKAKIRKI